MHFFLALFGGNDIFRFEKLQNEVDLYLSDIYGLGDTSVVRKSVSKLKRFRNGSLEDEVGREVAWYWLSFLDIMEFLFVDGQGCYCREHRRNCQSSLFKILCRFIVHAVEVLEADASEKVLPDRQDGPGWTSSPRSHQSDWTGLTRLDKGKVCFN